MPPDKRQHLFSEWERFLVFSLLTVLRERLLPLFWVSFVNPRAAGPPFHGVFTARERCLENRKKRQHLPQGREIGVGVSSKVVLERPWRSFLRSYSILPLSRLTGTAELNWPGLLHMAIFSPFCLPDISTQEGCRDVNSSQKSQLISAGQHLQHTKFLCVLRNSSKMIVAAQQFALCHLVLRYISLVSLCPVACEALRLSFRTTNCPTGPWHLPDHSRHWWKRD